MVATPAPPAPATTTTALEYEEDDSETKEEEGRRVPTAANGDGELGLRGNFIGSADDGQIGQQTERQGSIRRVGGEGNRSRDDARRCDIWILTLIDTEILL